MSVTISAVPVLSSDGQAAPFMAERSLSDFVAQMQESALSAPAHAANPAALATELLGTLRNYFDRARRFEKGISPGPEASGADMTTAPPTSEASLELHGGPARERLEQVESRVSSGVAVDLAQLHRIMDVALASMNFATETSLVVRGTSQISHSANTLLKGQ
jgi:NADH dehydrogenase/NADH:ubiquinone oxidoreductase subunit G